MFATILTIFSALATGAALQNPQAAYNATSPMLDLIPESFRQTASDLPATHPNVCNVAVPIVVLIAVTVLAHVTASRSSHDLLTAVIGYTTMYWLHAVNFILVSVFGSNKRLRFWLELFGFGRDGLIARSTAARIQKRLYGTAIPKDTLISRFLASPSRSIAIRKASVICCAVAASRPSSRSELSVPQSPAAAGLVGKDGNQVWRDAGSGKCWRDAQSTKGTLAAC